MAKNFTVDETRHWRTSLLSARSRHGGINAAAKAFSKCRRPGEIDGEAKARASGQRGRLAMYRLAMNRLAMNRLAVFSTSHLADIVIA